MILHLILSLLLLAAPAFAGTLSRPSGPIVTPDEPNGCRPGSVYIISGQQQCCEPDGVTLVPCGSTPAPPTTGIRTTTTEVESIRYAVAELSGVAQLGTHAIVLATVGTTGSTFTVPNPADTAVPGWIKIIIKDSGVGTLTLVPYGTTLINGANTSPPSITGIRSSYELFRIGDNEWRVESFSRQGYGEPAFVGQDNTYTYGTQSFQNATAVIGKGSAGYAPTAAGSFGFDTTKGVMVYGENGATKAVTGALSVGFGGSTNDSSSGSGSYVNMTPNNAFPANFLTLGKTIRACAGFSITTGSAAPVLSTSWRIGTTALGVGTDITPSNNLASRGYAVCVVLVAAAAPSASSNIYFAPITILTASTTGTIANFNTAQPAAFATNGALTLQVATKWATAGTGTNTITLEWLTVEASN